MKTHFLSITAIKESIGKEVGITEWLCIDQERINQFAIAINDLQWIHTDPIRAKKESPYKKTIAHGFLNLSLLSQWMYSCISFEHAVMTVNYGLDRVRFTSPVLVGDNVRARFTIQQVEDIAQGIQIKWLVTLDIADQEKPAMVAVFIINVYTKGI